MESLSIDQSVATKEDIMRTAIILSLMLFTLTGVAQARDWWEESQPPVEVETRVVAKDPVTDEVTSASRVNWNRQYVEVMAFGSPDMGEMNNMGQAIAVAHETAEDLAFVKLANVVQGMTLESERVYDMSVQQMSDARLQLEGFIRGARVIESSHEVLPDGTVLGKARVGILLNGEDGLISFVADKVLQSPDNAGPDESKPVTASGHKSGTTQGSASKAAAPAPKAISPVSEAPNPDPAEPRPEAKASAAPETVSGLIIDARSLGAKPTLTPRVFSLGGETIYEGKGIPRKYVVSNGLAGYARTAEQARTFTNRIGDAPLLIKAASVRGVTRSDIIISDTDAERLLHSPTARKAMRECRVVIVVD